MAETEQDERTEQPSARRLQQARERGQVPRSRELVNFATMIGGSGAIVVLGGWLASHLTVIMHNSLSIDPAQLADPQSMLTALGAAIAAALQVLVPIFGIVLVLTLAAALALGGWNVSMQSMAPDFSRLNPFEGLKRLFGLQGAMLLGEALLKVVVVGVACAAVSTHFFTAVMALGHMAPRAAIGRGAQVLCWAFLMLCSSLAIVALVDVPMQIFQFNRRQRMTRQELRDEARESEGNPETKRRIRQMQQMVARRRMMQKVPAADVVIVNPTHFAVALKYDPNKMRAPRVLAKGVDLVAQNIRRVAAEHRIAVFESPKLARALYRSTDLDREIPAGLYLAVAQVLSYVFRVRTLNPTLAARVVRPDPTLSGEYEEA
jgi:flagellar biosynthetic protein FlhB